MSDKPKRSHKRRETAGQGGSAARWAALEAQDGGGSSSRHSGGKGGKGGPGGGSSRPKVQTSPSRRRSPKNKIMADVHLVGRVQRLMQSEKLSQVTVGHEARVSQAVISQWLGRKYHGHNEKVDAAMRYWLETREERKRLGLAGPAPMASSNRPPALSNRKSTKRKKEEDVYTAFRERPSGSDRSRERKRNRPSGLMWIPSSDRNAPNFSITPRDGQMGQAMPSPWGQLVSPSEFAPLNVVPSADTPVELPVVAIGAQPDSAGTQPPTPFWMSNMRPPSTRGSSPDKGHGAPSGSGYTPRRSPRSHRSSGCNGLPVPLPDVTEVVPAAIPSPKQTDSPASVERRARHFSALQNLLGNSPAGAGQTPLTSRSPHPSGRPSLSPSPQHHVQSVGSRSSPRLTTATATVASPGTTSRSSPRLQAKAVSVVSNP